MRHGFDLARIRQDVRDRRPEDHRRDQPELRRHRVRGYAHDHRSGALTLLAARASSTCLPRTAAVALSDARAIASESARLLFRDVLLRHL